MRATPNGRDLRRLLTWTGELLELDRDSQLPTAVLGGAASVIGSETATITHLDLATGHEVAVLWPPSRIGALRAEAYARLAHTHPLRRPALAAATRSGQVQPIRVGDVLTAGEWRRSPLRVDAMPDVSDQMTVPLFRRGTVLHALTLGRHAGSFTDRQRELLAHAAAHLRAVTARLHANRRDGGGPALQLAPRARWVALGTAPGVRTAGAPSSRTAQPPVGTTQLSGRERDVLRLVAEGLTDAQVARRLGLQPPTVSRHLHRVYRRHGVANRAAAVRLLADEG